PAAAAFWTGCVLAMIALPALLPFVSGIVPRRRGISKRSHVRAVGADLALGLAQIAFVLALLAHQAWTMTDAIVRTLFRLFVRRRHLLEWTTAAQAKFSLPLDIGGFYPRVAGRLARGRARAVATAVVVSYAGHGAALIAAPFAMLWALSPIVAQWASRPTPVSGSTP